MSLFNPSGHFLAYPPPLDVPINQPALGDNIAWNHQDDSAYDQWAHFEGGFDDSWAWDGRKEAPWDEVDAQGKSVIISVRPSTKSGESGAQTRTRRRGKAQVVETSEAQPEAAAQAEEDAPRAEHDWLQDPALALEAHGFAPLSADAAPAPLNAFEDSLMQLDFTDPNLFNDEDMFGTGALDVPMQPEMPQIEGLTTFDASMTAGFNGFDGVVDPSWLQGAAGPLPTTAPSDIFAGQYSSLPDFQLPLMELETPGSKSLDPTDTDLSSDGPAWDMMASTPAETPMTASSPAADDELNRLVTCATCQKVVKKRKLRDHMRWHNKTRECEICQKSFTTDKDLRRHEKQHTGDKPFKCEVFGCKYAETGFARMDNLRRHVKKIHGTSP